MSIEESMVGGPVVGTPLTGEALVNAVRLQVEYYFSKDNLQSDAYLNSLMDAQNSAPLNAVMKVLSVPYYYLYYLLNYNVFVCTYKQLLLPSFCVLYYTILIAYPCNLVCQAQSAHTGRRHSHTSTLLLHSRVPRRWTHQVKRKGTAADSLHTLFISYNWTIN